MKLKTMIGQKEQSGKGEKMENKNQNPSDNVNGVDNLDTTANNQTNNQKTFDDILSNKEYQAEFDRRVQKAIKTHEAKLKEQWELEQDTKKSEDEKLAKMNETQKVQYQLKKQKEANLEIQKKLNARDLKDEGIKIAINPETAFDPEFLNLLKFEDMTQEELHNKTKKLKVIQDRIAEKVIKEWLNEGPQYNYYLPRTKSKNFIPGYTVTYLFI